MTLLEVITEASSTNTAGFDEEFTCPVVLNPDPIFPKLKPETDGQKSEEPVEKVTGWEISQTDTELLRIGRMFCNPLRKKLKNTNTFGRNELLGMFTSYLEKVGEKVGMQIELDNLDERYACKLIEKLGSLMGRNVKILILEASIVLEVWDVLESLIINSLVEHSCTSILVYNLIEKRKSDLIVLCMKHLLDLQTYEIMSILKYFLMLPGDGYKSLVTVRKDWESQALLAIEKTSDKEISRKKRSLATDAAQLVMLAYDGFSVTELCLHYLLVSWNLDEAIFSACVGKLNGEEIKALIQYLGKWLRKYERFPQVGPCPKASSALGLKICDWIPTLEDVVKCLGLVVDEHFSSVVLHSEFHEELRSIEEVVRSLAAEAKFCGTLANLTEILRSEHKA